MWSWLDPWAQVFLRYLYSYWSSVLKNLFLNKAASCFSFSFVFIYLFFKYWNTVRPVPQNPNETATQRKLWEAFICCGMNGMPALTPAGWVFPKNQTRVVYVALSLSLQIWIFLPEHTHKELLPNWEWEVGRKGTLTGNYTLLFVCHLNMGDTCGFLVLCKFVMCMWFFFF